MSRAYAVDESKRMHYAGIYLLEHMVSNGKTFALFLPREEVDLESILEWLLVQGWVRIENEEHYAVAPEGLKELKAFAKRYTRYLNDYDIFSAVDLEAGEFAFSSYHDFDSDAEWKQFLDDERWEDLRLAVAAHRGMDPVEVVFMNFIQEKRFGRDATGWQFDLLLGSVWDGMLEICNTALHAEDLGYEAEGELVSGEAVIEDVIAQGVAERDRLIGETETPPPLPGAERWERIAHSNNGSMPPPLPDQAPPLPGDGRF